MSSGESAAAPGWYHGEGDPLGTQRYWDGIQWVGEHRPVPAPQPPPPPPLAAAPPPAVPAGLSPAFETGEGKRPDYVRPELRLASPGARIGARIIDSILVTIVSIGLFIVFFAAAVVSDRGEAFVAVALLAVLGSAAYEIGFVALAGGTPGKLAVGIRVARLDGTQPPGWGPALGRWALNLITWVPFFGQLALFGLWIVSFILLFSDPERRTLFDRVGGTVVVEA